MKPFADIGRELAAIFSLVPNVEMWPRVDFDDDGAPTLEFYAGASNCVVFQMEGEFLTFAGMSGGTPECGRASFVNGFPVQAFVLLKKVERHSLGLPAENSPSPASGEHNPTD